MVAQDACHRHFYRESLCDNENYKNAKTCILTFVENPCTKTTTTKGALWTLIVFLALKRHVYEKCLQNQRERHHTRSTWLNNNYL